MSEFETEDIPQVISSIEDLKVFLTNSNNCGINSYLSSIPDVCKEYPCCLGIDEAGRGPVLGPMSYATAFCPINEGEFLASLNCNDSKAMKEKDRENVFELICKNSGKIGWSVDVISPNKICNSMLSLTKHSLNAVSQDAAVNLIRRVIDAGVKLEHIFVDTVGPSDKYKTYLQNLFPKYKITVEQKADATYPIVSAASICAKVVRDCAINTWQFIEGSEFDSLKCGSGYPGDPVTKSFLNESFDKVFGFPQFVRFSWSTASKILEEKAYLVEWNADEKEVPANTVITSFFKKDIVQKEKTDFFTQRCLTQTTEL